MRTIGPFSLSVVFAFVLGAFGGSAQSSPSTQLSQVPAGAELQQTVSVPRVLPDWVATASGSSPLPADTPLRLTFVLNRSSERQAAFTKLLRDQQDPASPRYHHWLTPAQVGALYGPSETDVDALVAWLASQGLPVLDLAPSRLFLTVGAPAATIADALQTTFRLFSVGGTPRLSVASEPSLPAAFAPLVQTIVGLSESELRPQHTRPEVHPAYTATAGTHAITPGDFSVFYDLAPAAGAGLNGSGQKVAVLGRSRVASSDITAFQSLMGLPSNLPTTIVPPGATDPGVLAPTADPALDDQLEAVLDLERLLGTAPGIHADLVVAASTYDAQGNTTSDGLRTAAQYEVQTLMDPVMNVSFSSCEAYAGPSGVSYWDALFSQAASEGISVVVASGDSGASACNNTGDVPPHFQIRSINSLCSSSYATCVGATQFADTANSAQYWSSTNASPLTSALSYIPEGAWNEPSSTNSNGSPIFVSAATGGGASLYLPKPAWQTGTGVPVDHARDVPDLSFAGAKHDGYYICYAAGGADCAQHNFATLGGSSAAAPAVAAVAALLNQKTASSTGNLNALLYSVAASTPSAFHDATPASSGVSVCDVNTPSPCNNSTPSYTALTGGTVGYALTSGYDQATGLGSLDIANFLTAAAAVPVSTLTATRLAVTGTSSTIRDSQTGGVSSSPSGTPSSVTFTATLTVGQSAAATGTVQFYINGYTLGSAVTLSGGQAATPVLTFANAGYYLISAVYSGDATFKATTAPGIPLLVTGFVSTTTATISATTIPIGSTATFQSTVSAVVPAGTTPNPPLPVPTGAVGVTINGNVLDVANLNNGVSSSAVSITVPGTYQLQAFYYGDNTYSTSSAPAITVVVPKLASITRIASSTASPAPALAGTFTAVVAGANNPAGVSLPAPTGTVQLYANGTALGSALALTANQPLTGQSQAASTALSFAAAGVYSITATYSGDSFYLPDTSAVTTLTVPAPRQIVLLSAATPSFSFAAGGSATDLLTLASPDGDTGTFNMACTVAYKGTTTVISAPVCTLPQAQLTLNTGVFATQETLTLTTNSGKAAVVVAGGGIASWGLGAAALAILLCLFAPRGKGLPRLVAVFLLCAPLGFSGCTFSRLPSTTSSGDYTVTVTATPTVSGAPAPAPLVISLTIQ